MKILAVIDMQRDFIDGALGSERAKAIVPAVKEKIESFDGKVVFTRDSHSDDYLQTLEGSKLPVKHCVKGSPGARIHPELEPFCKGALVIDKSAFGSVELARRLRDFNEKEPVESVCLVGLCTDICVISNALLIKAFLPEVPVIVDASRCAGVSPESHETALDAMAACQVEIVNR